MSTELELNLRLDSNCRTTFDPDSEFIVNNKKSISSSPSSSLSSSSIDYSSKTVLTSLSDDSTVKITTKTDTSIKTSNNKTNNMNPTTISQSCSREEVIISQEDKMKLLDDLLFDCEITDCALLPRTFWMPCSGMEVSLVSSIGYIWLTYTNMYSSSFFTCKLVIDTSNHNNNNIIIICTAKMLIRTVCIRGI